MADPNFSWIYLLIFLAIPFARIIPRLIARRRQNPDQRHFESQFDKFDRFDRSQMETTKPKESSEQPLTNDKMVLRELNQGVKTFEKIQKNTGLDTKTLDSVLGDLEKDGFMKVVQKQGVFGIKTELYPTDKGFKEYYS